MVVWRYTKVVLAWVLGWFADKNKDVGDWYATMFFKLGYTDTDVPLGPYKNGSSAQHSTAQHSTAAKDVDRIM
jgi:hypothetical protein